MGEQIAEIRRFLGEEGGMQVTYPDKAPFIAAAQRVQDKYAAEKGEDFQDLLSQIRSVAQ